jgi:hypothetical protein
MVSSIFRVSLESGDITQKKTTLNLVNFISSVAYLGLLSTKRMVIIFTIQHAINGECFSLCQNFVFVLDNQKTPILRVRLAMKRLILLVAQLI